MEYFFDSYALIELIKGNPNYLRYSNSAVTITLLNLIEVTNAIFNEFGETSARKIYQKFEECVQEIDLDIVMEAIILKQRFKKRYLSYADCIGYAFARKKGMYFLTGDKEFEDLKDVEFVKK